VPTGLIKPCLGTVLAGAAAGDRSVLAASGPPRPTQCPTRLGRVGRLEFTYLL